MTTAPQYRGSMTDTTKTGRPAFPINELNQRTGDVCAHHLGRSLKAIELRLRRAKAKTGQHTYGLIALWAAYCEREAE